MSEPLLVRRARAMEILGVGRRVFRRMVAMKMLRPVKVGRKCLYRLAEVRKIGE